MRHVISRRLCVSIAICIVAATGGCSLWPEVDCGPLAAAECTRAVDELRERLGREFPNRSVVYVQFINDQGHASVRLDDGTEIGVGERL